MNLSGMDPFNYGWAFKFNVASILFTSILFTYLVAKSLMEISGEIDDLAASIVSFTIYYQVNFYK